MALLYFLLCWYEVLAAGDSDAGALRSREVKRPWGSGQVFSTFEPLASPESTRGMNELSP